MLASSRVFLVESSRLAAASRVRRNPVFVLSSGVNLRKADLIVGGVDKREFANWIVAVAGVVSCVVVAAAAAVVVAGRFVSTARAGGLVTEGSASLICCRLKCISLLLAKLARELTSDSSMSLDRLRA